MINDLAVHTYGIHKAITMLSQFFHNPLFKKSRKEVFSGVRESWIFIREFIQSPSSVGSICPSSRFLAGALIGMIPAGEGLIVDLGAGSGIVSEALVRSGIAPDRIMPLEISNSFCGAFTKRCPDVPLVVGDACALESIIATHYGSRPVCAIVSSLPIRVLHTSVQKKIMAQIRQVLATRGGVYVQYTYAWWRKYPLSTYDLRPQAACIVMRNIPPAKVEAYTFPANDHALS